MPVVVQGVVDLKRALNKFAPDLKKQMDAEVRAALKPVIADAKEKVPNQFILNNWNYPGYERKSRTSRNGAFPSFNQTIIRKGLTFSLATKRNSSSGFVSLFTLLNKSAAGAIIETAGRNPGSSKSQSNNPNAGAQFVGAMNQIGGLKDYAGKGRITSGRLLYAAYDRNQGKALDAVMKAIDKASKALQARAQVKKAA